MNLFLKKGGGGEQAGRCVSGAWREHFWIHFCSLSLAVPVLSGCPSCWGVRHHWGLAGIQEKHKGTNTTVGPMHNNLDISSGVHTNHTSWPDQPSQGVVYSTTVSLSLVQLCPREGATEHLIGMPLTFANTSFSCTFPQGSPGCYHLGVVTDRVKTTPHSFTATEEMVGRLFRFVRIVCTSERLFT